MRARVLEAGASDPWHRYLASMAWSSVCHTSAPDSIAYEALEFTADRCTSAIEDALAH